MPIEQYGAYRWYYSSHNDCERCFGPYDTKEEAAELARMIWTAACTLSRPST